MTHAIFITKDGLMAVGELSLGAEIGYTDTRLTKSGKVRDYVHSHDEYHTPSGMMVFRERAYSLANYTQVFAKPYVISAIPATKPLRNKPRRRRARTA